MATVEFKGKKVIGASASGLTILTYRDRQYLRTTNISGTPSTYKYLGTGDNLDGVSADSEEIKHAQEFMVSEEHYITDQLNNKYHLVFVPMYDYDDVNDVDADGRPLLVGRAPGGKFGGK